MSGDGAWDLGPCCMCEGPDARNIIMLDRWCAVPGHGWGCVVCDLPADGAVAVLCDECRDEWQTGASLKVACRGYPASDGRIAIDDLPPGEFAHDRAKHGGER